MIARTLHPLVQLRPRDDIIYVSQNRTVLATELNGFITEGPERGLFFQQTRLLSRYRYLIDDKPPLPVALSNVEQHSWLGYYIALSPNAGEQGDWETLGPGGKLAQRPIELHVSRFIGDGMHEDLALTNFTQEKVTFMLTVEVDADFADSAETKLKDRLQRGKLSCEWRRSRGDDKWELAFDYRAEHKFDHQGNRGTAHLHRGIIVKIDKSDSEPLWKRGTIRFQVELKPHAIWRAGINFIPVLEGEAMSPLLAPAFTDTDNRFDSSRRIFVDEATRFATSESETLAPIVATTLERAREDAGGGLLRAIDSLDRMPTLQ